jgi:hypothetical protein
MLAKTVLVGFCKQATMPIQPHKAFPKVKSWEYVFSLMFHLFEKTGKIRKSC